MSNKFKPGDLVRIVKHRTTTIFETQQGAIGEIIRFLGNPQYNHEGKQIIVRSAWEVKTQTSIFAASEDCLILIPGGDESKKAGSWDECPWKPSKSNLNESVT